jgi:hypothetical protein
MIMPTLVCRRAPDTVPNGQRPGLFIIEPKRQFITPTVDEDSLREVRTELGLDLIATSDPDELIAHRLLWTLPDYARDRCKRWAQTVLSEASSAFGWIATDAISKRRRNNFDVMRQLAERDGLVHNGGW